MRAILHERSRASVAGSFLPAYPALCMKDS